MAWILRGHRHDLKLGVVGGFRRGEALGGLDRHVLNSPFAVVDEVGLPRQPAMEACSRASSKNSARAERGTRQRTIRRAKASITKATWTKPDQVAPKVKSLTLKAFGRGAVNCRFTLSRGRDPFARHLAPDLADFIDAEVRRGDPADFLAEFGSRAGLRSGSALRAACSW